MSWILLIQNQCENRRECRSRRCRGRECEDQEGGAGSALIFSFCLQGPHAQRLSLGSLRSRFGAQKKLFAVGRGRFRAVSKLNSASAELQLSLGTTLQCCVSRCVIESRCPESLGQ